MAQNTRGSSGQVAAPFDGILATKLHTPRLPPGFVPRRRLTDHLDEGVAQGVVLICAPAGFGKTVTVADWAQHNGSSVVWLTLDSSDNNPSRFWNHVLATLDRPLPGLAHLVSPLLGPPAPPSFEGVITALINNFTTSDEDPVTLIVDDYHMIEADEVHQAVRFLLEHRPLGLNLVLTSRADPPLPFARLRARGELGELRAEDLQFTVEEAADLLADVVPLDEEGTTVVETLTARTEGWVAGLQLANLSLRGGKDAAEFVRTFGGSNRYVLDYLTDEVLAGLSEETRMFLLETSVLDRLCGALCNSVTGRSDSQAMLEDIERANLFLVSLDDEQNWWRYHHLFAELLRSRLQRELPTRVSELHRAASQWHEAEGTVEDAVSHATSAGDIERAAWLIENAFDALYLTGKRGGIKRWLTSLPSDLVASRPRLGLVAAFMALASGDLAALVTLLDTVEDGAESASASFSPSVGRAGSLLDNVPAAVISIRAHLAEVRGDPEETLLLAERALAELGSGESLQRSALHALIGKAEWTKGRAADAEGLLAASIGGWLDAGELGMASWATDTLGQVQRSCGRLEDALATYYQLLEARPLSGKPSLNAEGAAHVGIGEIAYQRGDLDRALEHIDEAITRSGSLLNAHQLSTALAALAWVRFAEGDEAGARDVMEEAVQKSPSPAMATLVNSVPVDHARLALALDDLDSVTRWVEERGLHEDDQVPHTQKSDYLVLARLLTATGQPDAALSLLGRLGADAITQGRSGDLIEIEAVSAVAFAGSGREDEALSTLSDALTRAQPEGYLRVFADEGIAMANLIGRLVAAGQSDGVALAYLGRLATAFGDASTGISLADVKGSLVVPLTQRELEVLRLVAAGHPNRRIADELYIATNTVKHHVTHILDKLGSSNRTEAVSRARELELLS